MLGGAPQCTVCGSHSTLAGPHPGLTQAAAPGQPFAQPSLRRLAGWVTSTAFGVDAALIFLPFLALPPPLTWLLTLQLVPWLRYLSAHLGRWTDNYRPSPPLFIGGHLVCIWSSGDAADCPQAPPGSVWNYGTDAQGHQLLMASIDRKSVV